MSHGSPRRRRGGLLMLAAALAVGAALWATVGSARHQTAASDARHPPVVLLVLDELPIASLLDARGEVDAARYPNFARLARGATWFRFATGADDFTRRAIPAILTGRLPPDRRFPVARNYPQNLFTAMHPDYDLHVQESGTHLCPYVSCRGGPNWGAELLAFLRTGRRPARTARWVASIAPRDRPSLYFAHALFPHRPWSLLPSGRSYFHGFENRPPKADAAEGVDDPFLVTHMWQRHLLQLGYTDRLLGTLIGRLERTGLWNRSLVIVTADHGLAFRLGEYRRTLTAADVGSLAPVPLFVKLPGQTEARTVERHVRTIDILPTIGDVAHVALPPEVEGRSLLDDDGEAPDDELVEMYERGGRLLRLPGPVVRRRLATVLRAQHARFGERSWSRLYRVGPHQELLGRRVVAPPSRTLRAEIDADEEYDSVDPRSGFVPSIVTARILGGRPGRRRDLAVAVDGRIAAVGRSVRVADDPAEYATILVPEETLTAGSHRVELLEVTAGGRGLALLGRAG